MINKRVQSLSHSQIHEETNADLNEQNNRSGIGFLEKKNGDVGDESRLL